MRATPMQKTASFTGSGRLIGPSPWSSPYGWCRRNGSGTVSSSPTDCPCPTATPETRVGCAQVFLPVTGMAKARLEISTRPAGSVPVA
ncbi:hypothetical protein Pme01_44110 [Planosporangium mesophilum]|uniref:Uncharacterized protein n=1 Tax=Planosporangium mesophilum TaxID=689768 RepID=A0A8J3X2V4_9ACTN|nr:hypothetical protein Pme01_44110 [Planosporangium mesophilum]